MQARQKPGPLDGSELHDLVDFGRIKMTTLKTLVAAALLSAFAVSSFAQAPVAPMAMHNAVQKHHMKHHHHHHHHAPVRR
jgi:hypothetical protein